MGFNCIVRLQTVQKVTAEDELLLVHTLNSKTKIKSVLSLH